MFRYSYSPLALLIQVVSISKDCSIVKHVKCNVIVFGTAVIFVALSPLTAKATEPPPNQSYDEKAISSLTTKSELPVEPLRSTSGTYEAEAGLVAVSIPKDPQKPVVISKQNESSAAFIKTSTSSIDMKQYVENSTVVNQGMNMSIGSQAIDGGMQQIAYIKKMLIFTYFQQITLHKVQHI